MADGLQPDQPSFDALYRQYGRRFKFLARGRGIPFGDCEDVVQDTFRNALKGHAEGKLADPAKAVHWLHGIFTNLVSEYWRTRQRHERLLPLGDSADIESAATLPLSAVIPRVREALVRLPRRHRLVLWLNTAEGWTTWEIARILNRSPGRVGAILADAKRMFRRHYLDGEENAGMKRLEE